MSAKNFGKLLLHLAAYGAALWLAARVVWETPWVSERAAVLAGMIYPRRVLDFFELFQDFYFYLAACIIFILTNLLVFTMVCLADSQRRLVEVVAVLFIFVLTHYFLLPFISIVGSVFADTGSPMTAVAGGGLSWFQLGFSGAYLVLTLVGFEFVRSGAPPEKKYDKYPK